MSDIKAELTIETFTGILPCKLCGQSTEYWNAPNDLWQRIIPGIESHVCANCFISTARKQGDIHPFTVFQFFPSPAADLVDSEVPPVRIGMGTDREDVHPAWKAWRQGLPKSVLLRPGETENELTRAYDAIVASKATPPKTVPNLVVEIFKDDHGIWRGDIKPISKTNRGGITSGDTLPVLMDSLTRMIPRVLGHISAEPSALGAAQPSGPRGAEELLGDTSPEKELVAARNKWHILCYHFSLPPYETSVTTISDRLEAAESRVRELERELAVEKDVSARLAKKEIEQAISREKAEAKLATIKRLFVELDNTGAIVCLTPRHEELRKQLL